jgi:hypothetical protein
MKGSLARVEAGA